MTFALSQESAWEMQCVILLWLSQLVTLPFELALLDPNVPDSQADTRCTTAELYSSNFVGLV